MVDKAEAVEHPQHYTLGGVEVLDAIVAWELSFPLGCVVKYVARAGRKPGEPAVKDLRKARFYLDDVIRRMEQAEHDAPHS